MPVSDRAPIVVKQRIQCLDIVRDERLLVASKGRLNLYLSPRLSSSMQSSCIAYNAPIMHINERNCVPKFPVFCTNIGMPMLMY